MARVRDGRKAGWFYADNRVLAVCMTLGSQRGMPAFCLYCAVAIHCKGTDRTAFASYTTLADKLRVDRRRVIAAVKALKGLGLLQVSASRNKRGGKASNVYTLLDPPALDGVESAPPPLGLDGVESAPPPPVKMVLNPHYPRCSSRTTLGVESALASLEQDPVNKTPLTTHTHACEQTDDDFAAFWHSYPLKSGEEKARREWDRLAPDAALRATILAAVEAQKLAGPWTRGKVHEPGNWLRDQRWRDKYATDGATNGVTHNAHAGIREFLARGRQAHVKT
jgi:hypothetical protein